MRPSAISPREACPQRLKRLSLGKVSSASTHWAPGDLHGSRQHLAQVDWLPEGKVIRVEKSRAGHRAGHGC